MGAVLEAFKYSHSKDVVFANMLIISIHVWQTSERKLYTEIGIDMKKHILYRKYWCSTFLHFHQTIVNNKCCNRLSVRYIMYHIYQNLPMEAIIEHCRVELCFSWSNTWFKILLTTCSAIYIWIETCEKFKYRYLQIRHRFWLPFGWAERHKEEPHNLNNLFT